MAGETVVDVPVVQENSPAVEEPLTEVAVQESEVENKTVEKSEDVKKDMDKKKEKKKSLAKNKITSVKPQVHKKDYEEDVVYLYQTPRTPQLPTISPYCLKLESWLKMQGVRYENVDHRMKLTSKAGQLPFVELNGEEIANSGNIIAVLAEKFGKQVMPAELTNYQRLVQHAMVYLIDNHFSWSLMHWRSRELANMQKGYKLDLAAMIGVKLPGSLTNYYFEKSFMRREQKQVKAQCFNADSADEMDKLGWEDMKVASEMLGENIFMFGDEPSLLDLVVYSQMAQVYFVANEQPCSLRDYMESECTNLVGLVNRMKDLCWGDDWEKATGDQLELNPHIPKPVVEEEKEEDTKENEKKEESKESEKKEETKENAKNEDEMDKENSDKETTEDAKEEKNEEKKTDVAKEEN